MPSLGLPKASPRLNDILVRTNTLLDNITGAVPTTSTISASNIKRLPLGRGGASPPSVPRKKRTTICIACGTRFATVADLDRHFNLKPDHSPYADSRLGTSSRSTPASEEVPPAPATAAAAAAPDRSAIDDKKGAAAWPTDEPETSAALASSSRPRTRSRSAADVLTSVMTAGALSGAPSSSSGPSAQVASSFSDLPQQPPRTASTPAGWLRARASSAAAADSPTNGGSQPTSQGSGGATSSWRIPRPTLRAKKSAPLSPPSTDASASLSGSSQTAGRASSRWATMRSLPAGRWTQFDDGSSAETSSAASASGRAERELPALPPAGALWPQSDAQLAEAFALPVSRRTPRAASILAADDAPPPPYTAAASTANSTVRTAGHRSDLADMFTDLDIFVRTSAAPPLPSSSSTRRGRDGQLERIEPLAASEMASVDPFDDDNAIDRTWLPAVQAGAAGSTSPRGRPSPRQPRQRASTNPFMRSEATALPVLRPPPVARRAASSQDWPAVLEPASPSATRSGGSSTGSPVPRERASDTAYFHPFFGVDAGVQAPRTEAAPSGTGTASDDDRDDDDDDVYADPLPDLVPSGGAGETDDRHCPSTPRMPATPDAGSRLQLGDGKMPGSWDVEGSRGIPLGRAGVV
ncbi:uncharacterized protein PFL1_00729 [Pseudozyma flocculosa PF-1]|uniref:uncharacterized protein n=1 Tax=Pseudozyma flocculosa PF-1 TaxID=1277687 RepID=UPI000456066F|nr:uncharacterized protein PFL1_00729 [Pseudozyma flocculosa PF-1]EPQ31394.1 hypothetical protein PFL1_00729 [Pseudozyma flocculosa PF-1]